MKAIVYCRVSTTEQVENTTLANQEDAYRKWCERERGRGADRPRTRRKLSAGGKE